MSAHNSLQRLSELTQHQCDLAAGRMAEARRELELAELRLRQLDDFIDEYRQTRGATAAWQMTNREGFRQRLDLARQQQRQLIEQLQQRSVDAQRSWEAAYRATRSLGLAAEAQRTERRVQRNRQEQRLDDGARPSRAASQWLWT